MAAVKAAIPWGFLLLAPALAATGGSGFFLRAGEFDAVFYAVQALELLAGAVNISLLCLNVRDGMTLASGPASGARARR